MRTPLLVVSLLAAGAVGFAGGIVFLKSKDHGERSPKTESATAKPSGMFRAITKFQILRPDKIFGDGSSESDLRWLATQIKTLESNEVRLRVVNKEQLAQKWKLLPQEAATRLARMTEVTLEPGTEIVSVSVFADDPDVVASLANATRLAYEGFREDQMKERVVRLSREIETEIEKQEQEVERRRLDMNDLVKKFGMSGPGGVFLEKTPQDQAEYDSAKRNYETSISLLNSIKEQVMRRKMDGGMTGKPVEVLEEARRPVP